MKYQFSDSDKQKIRYTLTSIDKVINQLLEWNKKISIANEYYYSDEGLQLLAANCTLFTAIGEGINRISRITDFLQKNYPEIPWKEIIGMRNRIAHGYFEIDADIIFDAIQEDIPKLQKALKDFQTQINDPT